MHTTTPSFYLGAEDPTSDPYAYVVGTWLADPSPQFPEMGIFFNEPFYFKNKDQSTGPYCFSLLNVFYGSSDLVSSDQACADGNSLHLYH